MRILGRRPVQAATALFVLVATLLPLASAVVAAPTMTLTPNKAPRDDGKGNQSVIQGTGNFGFTISSGSFHVYWDAQNSNNEQVPANVTLNKPNPGDFSFDLTVPLKAAGAVVRPGGHTVIAQACSVSTNCLPLSVSATFTIPKPSASLSKTQGRQLDGVFVFGNGFSPGSVGEPVRVTWDPGGQTQQILYENIPSGSTFSLPITIPDVPAGKYTIQVCDVPLRATACNALDTATTQFTVTNPLVTLDQSSGLASASFNVNGSRFHGGRELHVWFGSAANPTLHEISPGTPKTTNSDGFFGPYPYGPTDAPGKYIVTACTYSPINAAGVCDPNDTGTAPYTILAPPTPTPSPSPTPTHTPAPTASASPSPTPTASPTATPSPTPTASPSPTPTASPTAAPTPTAVPASPVPPSLTPTPIVEPLPSQTPVPTPTEAAPISWPEHLHTPGSPAGGSLDLATIGGISVIALLIAFLVPFPGTLFNKTVEANYAEILGWFGRARGRWNRTLDRLAVGLLASVRRWLGKALSGRIGVVVFLVLSALVYGFLSPSFGFDLNSAALFLGLLVGLTAITLAFDLPLRVYHRRRSEGHDGGVLRALWWTLLVAVICVAVSRLAGFQPGYLYGLIVSIVFVTEITARDEGIGTWLASVWLLVLSFVAWVALALVRQANPDPWLSLFLQTVLVTFVVAGIETLVIGLLPMRFLPGHPLFRWRKSMWFALFALSVFGYLLILVDPANGYLSDDSRTPMIVGVIFLAAFGTVSLATWAYFRFRPKPVGAAA